MGRFKESGDPVERGVVGKDRTEQRALGFDIRRHGPLSETKER
jgi:hypothetical protein